MSITASNFVIKEKGVLKDDSFQVSNTFCMPLLSIVGVYWREEGSKCMSLVCHFEPEVGTMRKQRCQEVKQLFTGNIKSVVELMSHSHYFEPNRSSCSVLLHLWRICTHFQLHQFLWLSITSQPASAQVPLNWHIQLAFFILCLCFVST